MSTEKIKDKIAKLLAKARGTENENEANLFMAKALKMLEEHQLEEWEVSQDLRNDPVSGSVLYRATTSAPTWMRHLWTAVGQMYDCRVIRKWCIGDFGQKYQEYFELHFVGPESSRVTTELMMPYILEQVRAAGRKLKSEGYSGSVDALTRRVANALVPRIYEIIAQQKREAKQEPSADTQRLAGDRSLVVVHAVDSYLAEHFGVLKMGKAGKRNTFGAARDAANKINLNRQVSGGGQLRIAGK